MVANVFDKLLCSLAIVSRILIILGYFIAYFVCILERT